MIHSISDCIEIHIVSHQYLVSIRFKLIPLEKELRWQALKYLLKCNNSQIPIFPRCSKTEEQKNAWDYIRIDGLNILKALCVPHYDVMQHNGLYRAKASERMVIYLPD